MEYGWHKVSKIAQFFIFFRYFPINLASIIRVVRKPIHVLLRSSNEIITVEKTKITNGKIIN